MEDSQVTSLIVESPRAAAPTTPVRVFVTAPFAFARRQRGRAWLFSLVVHGSVLALALWGLGREVITPAPTVHLVFVALPPAGVATGSVEGVEGGVAGGVSVPLTCQKSPSLYEWRTAPTRQYHECRAVP